MENKLTLFPVFRENMSEKKEKLVCYHCGLEMHPSEAIWYDDKPFCCNGCKTVYQILHTHDLSQYYTIQETPGIQATDIDSNEKKRKFAFLDNPEIAAKLLEFDDGHTQVVNFFIPAIHCASCIWVLEHLEKLNPGILHSEVHFNAKTVRITYNPEKITLRQLAELLTSIAYEPQINLDSLDKKEKKSRNKLILKLGIAGFAFGNIMLMALPGYIQSDEYWLNRFAPLFRWIMFGLSLPVVFYSASDYFESAVKGLRNKILNVDILIALGITVLFLRSTYEIVTGTGQGYFDSLTGLVFFLLVGKYFQDITYKYLSFERDYKSYFPIAVTKITDDKEEIVEIKDIRPGDRLLIHNEEIIPVDSVLMKNKAFIDYSFVTGESLPVEKSVGEKILAGGKQKGNFIEIEAISDVDNSYLTKLWSRDNFDHPHHRYLKNITDKVSAYFTVVILSFALIAGLYWWYRDGFSTAVWIMSAILIVACPCALALAGPFAFGNMLRRFGMAELYLKNEKALENMASVRSIVFDKTGTLTRQEKYRVHYEGDEPDDTEKAVIKSMTKISNHPLSRLIYKFYEEYPVKPLEYADEIPGKGIIAYFEGKTFKLGSASWTGAQSDANRTTVYFHNGERVKGRFVFEGNYREGIDALFRRLRKKYRLHILSGDNESEREQLKKLIPPDVPLLFNQSVHDKTDYIRRLQEQGEYVMMVGDGLNDAGALKQSDVGIAVAEDTNVFTPAADGILKANRLPELDLFLKKSVQTRQIIYSAFAIAFLYNVIGLGFAASNLLSPLIAAILMPVSSISVVIYVSLLTNLAAGKLK